MLLPFPRFTALVITALAAPVAGAVELAVLSGGAIEPGLRPAIADFEQATNHTARVTFNTAPQLRKRVESGERWDVVIAPPAVLDDLAKAGRIRNDKTVVGRVGLGVAVRGDAPVPDIATVETLQQAILAADSIVFNRASTGIYLEQWLRKAGLYDQVAAHTTRYDDGASVMEHLQKGKGNEIGFGAITEIMLYRDRGLRLVGPLPGAIQNTTTYAAASTEAGGPPAQLLVHYLGSPRGREFFRAAGIE